MASSPCGFASEECIWTLASSGLSSLHLWFGLERLDGFCWVGRRKEKSEGVFVLGGYEASGYSIWDRPGERGSIAIYELRSRSE